MPPGALALDGVEDGIVDEPLVDYHHAMVRKAFPGFLRERLLSGVVGPGTRSASVVWLVIDMALLRDRSIDEVVHHLDLVLPGLQHTGKVSRGAVIQARDRLGCDPLAVLFAETAQRWAGDAADTLRWRGLAVYGVDGSPMLIADTADNEIVFGRPHSGRSAGAYPQLRLVALRVLRAHHRRIKSRRLSPLPVRPSPSA